jgi:hypothetical protein
VPARRAPSIVVLSSVDRILSPFADDRHPWLEPFLSGGDDAGSHGHRTKEALMAALVVALSPAKGMGRLAGTRIGIFPGAATPSVFPAGTSFWVGYEFVAEQRDEAAGVGELGPGTRFELDVDGERIPMRGRVRKGKSAPARKADVAEFPAGLPAGWHDFAGRWYDGGRLVLSTRTSIEFVER